MRNRIITAFVIAWLLLFNYESLRAFYLNPLVGHPLPKFKFLFPPAGWIMFYHVGESEVHAEVFGVKEGEKLESIDPHRIFNIHWLGYDNIRRNILVSVLDSWSKPHFCRYLKRKFPEYERFLVMQVAYPSNIKYPGRRLMKIAYEC